MNNLAVANRLSGGQVAVNDRTRMFGYSAGAPGMIMDAKKSGLDCNPIEGGRLLMFVPGKDGYLGGLTRNGYQKLYVDMMPSDYALMVERRFHTSDDMGFRVLKMLTPLSYKSEYRKVDGEIQGFYEDEALNYFSVVHPPQTCPFDLEKAHPHHDPEVGTGEYVYTPCPTCRLANLQSNQTMERIADSSGQMDVPILRALHAMLVEANTAAVRHIERKKAMVDGDIAKTLAGRPGFRVGLNAIDRIHLKQLHKEENAQSNTQIETIKAFAEATVKAQQAIAVGQTVAPTTTPTITDAEYEEFLAFQAKKREAQERMAKARAAKNKTEETIDA